MQQRLNYIEGYNPDGNFSVCVPSRAGPVIIECHVQPGPGQPVIDVIGVGRGPVICEIAPVVMHHRRRPDRGRLVQAVDDRSDGGVRQRGIVAIVVLRQAKGDLTRLMIS